MSTTMIVVPGRRQASLGQVFVGTRVPVKSLYDYLEAGDSLDELLGSFPSVTREQAIAALELARTMTETHATASR